MTPEEIETAEFFVAMRGYERVEVRALLKTLAAERRELERRLAERDSGEAPAVDPIDELGRHVAAIVYSARESARAILDDAERDATVVRSEAAEEARLAREAVAAKLAEAERALEESREEAARAATESLERARHEAEAILADAGRRRDEAAAARDGTIGLLVEAMSGIQERIDSLRPGDVPPR